MSSTLTVGPYKGKYTHRSWPQLPEELVRHIATYFLWDHSATNYCPQQWEARELWHSRMVYTALRDATDLEKFMSICPQWSLAVETHLFWHQAVALIDPLDALGQFAVVHPKTNNSSSLPPLRITPYRHFRNITLCSCLVCRINSTTTNHGLGVAKRSSHTLFLGLVPLCREHNHRRSSFCGLCLREAPPIDPIDNRLPVAVLENEDEESWAGVEATCRTCRSEWLWRRVCNNSRDREAVGGPKFNSPDWETRQTVEGFIDLAEGSISDVIALAQEKLWLRKNTKLPELMSQALAASRYTGRENTFNESEEDLTLSEMEEEEEDADLMQMTEESGGVRDLAVSDWARNRILDGHWLAPADQYYGNTVPNRPTVVRSIHPCPWALDNDEDSDPTEEHPRQSIAQGEVPPSYALCERAYLAYQKQLRSIILPAMRNIVRKLVIECSADEFDPALKASRMSMEDVLSELRDEAVWFDGIDWLEKRRNARREQQEARLRHAREEGSDDSTSSTASSKSDDSHTTSPVLSTTTLQTTPSPPPIEDKVAEDVEVPSSRPVTIAVDPVLDPPRLLRPIPHIPVTVSHLPQYSMDSFKMVWREACAPLYHCRCSICERAHTKEPGLSVPSQAGASIAPLPLPNSKQVEIRLEEIANTDGEGEVEAEEEEEEEEEEADGNDSEVAEDGSRSSYSPSAYTPPVRSRKRSNEELEYDDADDVDAEGEMDEETVSLRKPRGRSPPKRLKRDISTPHRYPMEASKFLSGRMCKRSSEELSGAGGAPEEQEEYGLDKKRARLSLERDEEESAGGGDVASPPTSLTGTESPCEREPADSFPQERVAVTLCAVEE